MLALILIPFLILFSLDPNWDRPDTDLVRNDNHVVSYECLENEIKFRFDLIGDITNNLGGEWPRKDFFRIWVDYNKNGKIDSNLDRSFSPVKTGICKSLMLSRNKHTTCFFDSNFIYQEKFSPTKNSSSNHVYFELTLPQKELSESEEANVYIEIYDGSRRVKTYYPRIAPFFENTFIVYCKDTIT